MCVCVCVCVCVCAYVCVNLFFQNAGSQLCFRLFFYCIPKTTFQIIKAQCTLQYGECIKRHPTSFCCTRSCIDWKVAVLTGLSRARVYVRLCVCAESKLVLFTSRLLTYALVGNFIFVRSTGYSKGLLCILFKSCRDGQDVTI